ncbi:hypothetical protein ACROYT_G033052 [Oculina patagonica]
MDSLLQPILDTEEHPFCAEMMKRLDIQRKNEHFCDVILEVGSGDDQARLKAHRNVLCAAGPFFFNALNSDMKEKEEGVIRLKETSKDVMEKVLDYLYTGHVEITEEIAYELFTQADFFLMPNLKALTSKFIVKTLDISNCIMAYHFAGKYQAEELLKGAREFILANFVAVAGTEDFLNLSAEEIEEFISSDKIIVKAEEDVFQVIVKWMKNNSGDQDFLGLLHHVRCNYLSPSYVSDIILQHPLVKASTACEKFILDAMKEPSEGKWYKLADKLSTHHSYYYGLSPFNSKLFIIGACKERDGHIAECYDPSQNQWNPISAPEIMDRRTAAVALQGFLYVVGGRDRHENVLNTVQKYNPDTGRWQEVSPLSSPRSNVCAVTDGGYLYAIGGMSADYQYLDIVERFDPGNNTWSELPSMITKRAFASGTTIRGKVFVIGGLQIASLTGDACEMYDPDTNMWSSIPSAVAPRTYASSVSFKGQIYVNGVVQNEQGREVMSLQVFDVEKNEWKSCPENVLLYGWHEVTTLTIPNNILVKCREISEEEIQWREVSRRLAGGGPLLRSLRL